jgi:hypothetical protein
MIVLVLLFCTCWSIFTCTVRYRSSAQTQMCGTYVPHKGVFVLCSCGFGTDGIKSLEFP